MKHFVSSMKIDHDEALVTIDGVPFPYRIADPDGPTIERVGDGVPVQIVNLSVYVDGIIEVVLDGGRKFIDPAEGEVGEWARRMVREGLLEAFPDLVIP